MCLFPIACWRNIHKEMKEMTDKEKDLIWLFVVFLVLIGILSVPMWIWSGGTCMEWGV
jgi:hypothetical protein